MLISPEYLQRTPLPRPTSSHPAYLPSYLQFFSEPLFNLSCSLLSFLPPVSSSFISYYQLYCSLFKEDVTTLNHHHGELVKSSATCLSMQITQPSTHCLAHSRGDKKKKNLPSEGVYIIIFNYYLKFLFILTHY